MYFILTEFAANNVGNGGSGRISFWISIDPKCLFDFYVCEGKSTEDNYIFLEIQPDSLFRTLKSCTHIKMIRIKLTKRSSACLTVELELHSDQQLQNSRTVTHDIPIKILGQSRISPDDYQEPSIDKTTLSIHMPPLKLLKHMIERMKCLSEFVYLEATNSGTLTLKVEADSVSVCTYFRNMNNLPINVREQDDSISQVDRENEEKCCTVRLSLKRLAELVNALQFQPSRIICNFVNNKYAHFFVIHEDDLVLQYLISSVLA
jgi:HUS1 checkpoint protein